MAKRYSGRLIITVTYRDTSDYWTNITAPGERPFAQVIGAPAAGFGAGVAYDSPEAYDQTARAALSFAMNETCDYDQLVELSENGSPLVFRSKAEARKVREQFATEAE